MICNLHIKYNFQGKLFQNELYQGTIIYYLISDHHKELYRNTTVQQPILSILENLQIKKW